VLGRFFLGNSRPQLTTAGDRAEFYQFFTFARALGLKEAEMRMIGWDLHAAQQTIAMLDRETGKSSNER
jgi:hypothetical protein